MKNIIKISIALLIGASSLSSCVGELDQFPTVQQSSNQVYEKPENYKNVMAGIYSSYILNTSLADDQLNGYLRPYFNMQESCTDEVDNVWVAGNLSGINYNSWTVSDLWVSSMYYHIYNSISLCNELIRNSSDDAIAGFTDAEQKEIKNYRAQARFLRALSYSHALDFFVEMPFVTENDAVGAFIPTVVGRSEIFNYIISELKDITSGSDLSEARAGVYPCADKGAAYTLMARVYLNAEVYVNENHYTDCITCCNEVIKAGYSLAPDYKSLFNGDNHKRTDEIIFAFAVDATNSRTWGATSYIVLGERFGSETDTEAKFGVNSMWDNYRPRPEMVNQFADYTGATDKRAMFLYEGRSIDITKHEDTTTGYQYAKWSNLTDEGKPASDTGSYGVNTDFPMFRLADVYLMIAEAAKRGGQGINMATAADYINLIRERAYGSDAGNISAGDITLDFLLAERSRELYTECTRRTDLIRFGLFTSGYNWQWKGGVMEGKDVDDKYNHFPIPEAELSANPNFKNVGY